MLSSTRYTFMMYLEYLRYAVTIKMVTTHILRFNVIIYVCNCITTGENTESSPLGPFNEMSKRRCNYHLFNNSTVCHLYTTIRLSVFSYRLLIRKREKFIDNCYFIFPRKHTFVDFTCTCIDVKIYR